nr:immunoglobulin light chain junction region [Macaca mulatta]MOW10533.1 immunoglobulin light chain junction region [Macaca mulatta]MOW10884.1 immunoglobulin light chain junction region [Macaca mulatta]MOW12902.1 immunoglobulin light chain junction region [Macaca mulatta]MOW13555.1 immunoglobulin light chain junction region [Macaca mulatta]
CQQGSHWPLTF